MICGRGRFSNDHLRRFALHSPDLPTLMTRTLDLESRAGAKLLKLIRRESERKPHLHGEIRRPDHPPCRRCSSGPGANFEKSIDDLLVESRQRQKHVARGPEEIDRAGAVEGEVCIPIRPRGKFLPAFDLLQIVEALEERVVGW